MIIAYGFEFGRPGSNPEWGLIYYREHGGCNWPACKLIDGCSLALGSATVSVVFDGICHVNKVDSIA